MKLLVATRNPHKLREIREIFRAPRLELVSLDDRPPLPEVEEDGVTFMANAVKKAVTLALASHQWTLADDSGLEVESLGGEPGVRSARYAGEPADYEANNRLLLRNLEGAANRKARFRCAIALASPQGHAQVVEGTCGGRIVEEGRGTGGFGYDPLFVADGRDLTFAEMDPAEKNRISHRSAALAAARRAWAAVLESAEEPADFPPVRRSRRGGGYGVPATRCSSSRVGCRIWRSTPARSATTLQADERSYTRGTYALDPEQSGQARALLQGSCLLGVRI